MARWIARLLLLPCLVAFAAPLLESAAPRLGTHVEATGTADHLHHDDDCVACAHQRLLAGPAQKSILPSASTAAHAEFGRVVVAVRGFIAADNSARAPPPRA